MKIVKPMYLFFDYLYESLEQIGEETVSEWSHKEVPILKFCVIDIEDQDEKELSTQWAWIHDNEIDAFREMKEENSY